MDSEDFDLDHEYRFLVWVWIWLLDPHKVKAGGDVDVDPDAVAYVLGLPGFDAGTGPTVVPPREAPAEGAAAEPATPRLIHQTFRSWRDLRRRDVEVMRTWRALNPTWEIRYYVDADCAAFVAEHFPEYLSLYNGLPKAVERADLFRYLVVLKQGGFYADIDVECRVPLDSWVAPDAELIVGTENEFVEAGVARFRSYSRTRQLLQWAFGGAPGHPIMRGVVERIKAKAAATGGRSDISTLERTGPAVWSDAVHTGLRAAIEREGGLRSIYVLPRVAFGVNPNPLARPRETGVCLQVCSCGGELSPGQVPQ